MRLQTDRKKNGTMAALFGLFLALALLVTLPGAVTAADYYVDINTGTDATGYGLSPAMPWRTLHYAAGTAGLYNTSGNTLHVAAGEYRVGAGLEADAPLDFLIFDSAIVGDPAGGTVINASGASAWQTGLSLSEGCYNVAISNLEITGAPDTGIRVIGRENLVAGIGGGITISNCVVHSNYFYGIYLEDCDNTNAVYDNVIYDSSTGIHIEAGETSDPAGSPEVYNNHIYSGALFPMQTGISLSAGYGIASPMIYRNTIDGASGNGIFVQNWYATVVAPTIQYNDITNCGNGVCLNDCGTGATVSANKIYDNLTGILIDAYSEGSPTITNNLIYSTGTMDRGIFLSVQAFSGVFSPTIYHNTIDSAYMAGIETYDTYNNSAALTPRIQYNIVTNSGTGILDSSVPAEGLIVDYNCLFGNTANYGNVTPGANDKVDADPLYNDPANYDFHLTAGSPCIDAAVTSNIPVDLDGTDRTAQGTYPDIGCYEHLLIPSGNLPPAAPTCPSPATFTVFAPGQPVTLQGGPYSDPENDSHRSSHWLVNRFDFGPVNWMIDYETQSAGELTSYTVPGASFISGLAYHWAVGYQDSGSLGFSFPATDKNAVPPQRVFVVGTPETTSLPPMEPGTEIENYRMVSFSHIPSNPAATAVFGDDLSGGYNTTQYRIGVYDCEMGAGGYREYPDFAVLPGGAAWVLAREGLEPDITGVPVTTEVPVAVPLRYNAANGNGWNMVGPPNNLDYVWGDVGVVVHDPETGEELFVSPVRGLDAGNPYIDIRLWSWADGVYDAATTTMAAGSGYWVRAKQPNVSLVFPFEFSGPALVGQAEEARGVKTWLARSLDYVKQMAEKAFAPASAIAADDGPPPPMASLSHTSGDSSVDMSCFISTLTEE